jgi:sulfate adenylyltransferase subunit 2
MNLDADLESSLASLSESPASVFVQRTHLDALESEAIYILREVVAEYKNPVLMYSIGKDSAVLLHLLRKAFFPAPPPLKLLHVDTGWKFQAMYQLRDKIAADKNLSLIVHKNQQGVDAGLNPQVHGAKHFTDVMKTQGLLQALNQHGFDAAIGGARRDEEASRAKERVFSFRNSAHAWDPKQQRPELWNLYNTMIHKGESVRVFPLSNWTELDIWQYIARENIEIVPLYFAAKRPVIERDGALIMADDARLQLRPGEVIREELVRFRTLGCYPLTGAIQSNADSIEKIIEEMQHARFSERQGRVIDHDPSASMEKKKREGYF